MADSYGRTHRIAEISKTANEIYRFGSRIPALSKNFAANSVLGTAPDFRILFESFKKNDLLSRKRGPNLQEVEKL
ncbi:hypothetical protein DLM76_13175 [Leptospira yasudae]|nr:hypothetical protein DLM76_13175 [Leptospira yasudae]